MVHHNLGYCSKESCCSNGSESVLCSISFNGHTLSPESLSHFVAFILLGYEETSVISMSYIKKIRNPQIFFFQPRLMWHPATSDCY